MNLLRHRLGFALRETGQALEQAGCVLQGINSYVEELPRLNTTIHSELHHPTVPSTTWIAPSAQVAGDVKIGDNSSVWYNCQVRGDNSPTSVGHSTNLQDGVFVGSLAPGSGPTKIGSFVSVGHGAVLQACTVEDKVLIGMNAVVQPGATVESGAIVAAGAVVAEGAVVPRGELWAGSPAKRLRELKPEEAQYLDDLPGKYKELAQQHRSILDLMQAGMQAAIQNADKPAAKA